MEKDVQAVFVQLATALAAQLKINADLRAEMEALISTLTEDHDDFRSHFQIHLDDAKLSADYQRSVETAELIRKIVG